jgi:drug/metabolite transporter (DMT)-like permease
MEYVEDTIKNVQERNCGIAARVCCDYRNLWCRQTDGGAMSGTDVKVPLWKIIVAFGAVYIIWGSTYLVIRLAIDTMPPLLMAGTRFAIAGIILYFIMRWRNEQLPTPKQILNTAITGGLLLLCGNGGVTWAEQFIPTGIAALLNAMIPCWILLFGMFGRNGRKPDIKDILALLLGVIGIVVLVRPTSLPGEMSGIGIIAMSVVLFGSICWSVGSVFARSADMPASPFMTTAMQMLFGGIFLLIAGVLKGEGAITMDAISLQSGLALVYLTIFGSVFAFSAYVWLLRTVQPSRAASYAYVNPLIAVLLGWLFGSEKLTASVLVAAGLIVGAVILVTIPTATIRSGMARIGRIFQRRHSEVL